MQFKLDLLKLKQHALVKVGEWSPRQGVNITDQEAFFDAGTMNVTLVVVTILVSAALFPRGFPGCAARLDEPRGRHPGHPGHPAKLAGRQTELACGRPDGAGAIRYLVAA